METRTIRLSDGRRHSLWPLTFGQVWRMISAYEEICALSFDGQFDLWAALCDDRERMREAVLRFFAPLFCLSDAELKRISIVDVPRMISIVWELNREFFSQWQNDPSKLEEWQECFGGANPDDPVIAPERTSSDVP